MRRLIDNNRLYRDEPGRKVSGVCAGLAKHFDLPAWGVRLAVILLFFFAPVPVALAYVLGVLLIPVR